jgi:S-formylglutathione hydrolase FrmB
MNFGDLDKTQYSDRNPRYIMEQLAKQGAELPEFYVACGRQDFLLEANRSIAQGLRDAGAKVTYEDDEGGHQWEFWDEYIQHVLKWLDYHVESRG